MARKNRRRRSFFNLFFKIILIIFSISLLLCYLSVFVDPEIIPVFSLFGLYFFPIVLINLILLIIAASRRSSFGWITFIMLIPTLFFADSFIRFGEKKKIDGDGIGLMTYNVGKFAASGGDMTVRETQRKIAAFISEQNPDIAALQEFRIGDTSKIRSMFPRYPFIQKSLLKYRNGEYFAGNVTLSKYPITGGEKITFKGSTNMAMFSDIAVKDSVIRVYNLHLESNSISMTSLIKKMKGNYEDFSNEFANANEKVRHSSSKRTGQVKYILDDIQNSKYEALICGDVNDTPISFCFRKLSKGRKDTFAEGGNGFGATYSVLWPLLRIDYVLVPEYFKVISHRTLKVKYSDHYPVMTKINFDYDRKEQGN